MKTGWESFVLDVTIFEVGGRCYLCWAQFDRAPKGDSCLFLAEMASPLALRSEAMLLTRPELPWELVRHRVNEGPSALIRNGRIFITYSASGTGAEYCMGLMSAPLDADLLNPKSWTKSSVPVFASSEASGIFGPGHNSFTTSKDGKTDYLVFHARNYREIQGDPLRDPNRHTRVQAFGWKADGSPDFGIPEKERR